MTTTRSAIVRQFGKPSGPLGLLAGLVMRVRPSNRLRSSRTLDLLDLRPADRVLAGDGARRRRVRARASPGMTPP